MNPYAALPRVDDLLAAAAPLVATHGRDLVLRELRDGLERARAAIAGGGTAASADQVLATVRTRLGTAPHGPRRAINAAGVLIHTNLGRAPLTAAAREAMADAAGYCDLEYDLETGGRGSRGSHVDGLLAAATGAEDAMTVNNCAAALVLVLAALAGGRQVVVSRGHLVEIGGSFRLPDIMAASTAKLLEVGTTNRTRAQDYRAGSDVAALLTVHPSNFTQDGFVTQPDLPEVAAVARERGVPFVHDAGSGLLRPSSHPALRDEPSMADGITAGADVVVASGDKLLGGPQAGLIVGSADAIARCRRHPLARAMRLDKLRVAALSATLAAELRGEAGSVTSLLDDSAGALEVLRGRATALATRVAGVVTEAVTMIGGGSAPGAGVVSPVVRLAHERPNRLAARLRERDVPVIVRVEDGDVVVDLRTVDPGDDDVVATALITETGGTR